MPATDPAQKPNPVPGSGATSAGRAPSARLPLHQRGGTRRFRRPALVVGGLVAIVAVRMFLLQPTAVTSASMEPTIDAGGVVWINLVAPRLGSIEAGSVVAARLDDGATVVKRLMATEGQTVELYEGVLRIDGRALDEPYADSRQMGGIFFGPIRVPEDHVFLMGDNRLDSIDSRAFGPVDEDAVQGVVAAAWPRLF